jgi:hypothetical protein
MFGFDQVHEVSFRGTSPDYHDANWRAYMCRQMKDGWRRVRFPMRSNSPCRSVCRAITLTARTKLVLESKSDLAQRGEASPDDADALALTFAQHVMPIEPPEHEPVLCDIFVGGGWMRLCCYAEAKRYTITDEMPPELHNLSGRKVTHEGIYTEARIKASWTFSIWRLAVHRLGSSLPCC